MIGGDISEKESLPTTGENGILMESCIKLCNNNKKLIFCLTQRFYFFFYLPQEHKIVYCKSYFSKTKI